MIALYLVVAFVGGMVCSVFASGKNRDAFGWFVIGFLLPLIGVILIVVLPANEAPSPTSPRTETKQTTHLDDLQKLADLRDRGVLSAEEFEDKERLVLERSERVSAKPESPPDISVAQTDEPEAKELLSTAQKHHFAKEFEDARREYQSLVSRFPASKQAAVARQQLVNLKGA